MITFDRATEIISKEINGVCTFDEEHEEALKIAYDILVKVRNNQVVVKFDKGNYLLKSLVGSKNEEITNDNKSDRKTREATSDCNCDR